MLSIFALVVGIGHIVVIMVYFFGLIRDNDSEFVSDLLSSDPLYVNIMTFFVLLQLTACFGLVRLNSSRSTLFRVAVESVFLAVSWVGWCILIIRYRTDNGVSKLHFLGVGLFVSGGVVYFAFLIWEMYRANGNEYANATLMLLYISSIVLGFLFIYGYFSGWGSSWVFEHCAFMLFSASHIFLFCMESNGSSSSSDNNDNSGLLVESTSTTTTTDNSLFSGVRIQFDPPMKIEI
jgi:hypothetical protein